MNHTALLVDFLAIKGEVMAPVMKDEQAGIDSPFACGHIVYVIDGLFNAGISIELCAKFHTNTFQIADEHTVWEMSCTIEAHVFQEVSQTALALLLLDGAHLLGDVEEGLTFGLFIVTDVVGQSVVKMPHAHAWIHRKRLHHRVLCRNVECCQCSNYAHKQRFHFHIYMN